MSGDYASFEVPQGFWSQLKDLDGHLHTQAPLREGGWKRRQAACGWRRPYEGPRRLPADSNIVTLWEGQRRLGGLFELTGTIRIFEPTSSLAETGQLRVHEKRILYEASFPAAYAGYILLYHHDYTLPLPKKTQEEKEQYTAIGQEIVEKGLLQPTTMDYKQLLKEMRVGVSGAHMLPPDSALTLGFGQP